MISSSPATDALWLDTLARICGRAAHELKGVMNGVSVNLEVVRTRAAKPDVPASSVASFANAAAGQFDAVMEMTEALLALARTPERVEVGRTARQLGALLVPVARVEGRELVIEGSVDTLGATTADANAVRAAIGLSLLAALESAPRVACRVAADALQLVAKEGEVGGLSEDARAIVREAGIEVQAERSAISITFPR